MKLVEAGCDVVQKVAIDEIAVGDRIKVYPYNLKVAQIVYDGDNVTVIFQDGKKMHKVKGQEVYRLATFNNFLQL